MYQSSDHPTQFGSTFPVIGGTSYQKDSAGRGRRRMRPTLEEALFESGYQFDFFQAVSLLEAIYPQRQSVGTAGGHTPAVRFAANSSSSSFAASSIYEIQPATEKSPVARMTVGFMGLTGPAGLLPQHYTELLQRIEFEATGPQKYALRDWFDLFNDRLIALFYRSWKKYRPFSTHLDALRGETDSFTHVLQSLAGWGTEGLSAQLHKFVPAERASEAARLPGQDQFLISPSTPAQEQRTASDSLAAPAPSHRQGDQEDSVATPLPRPPLELALLRYTALFAQRPRCASNLQSLLEDYFGLPVTVQQFYGNWLTLDESAQTRLGFANGNSVLGQNAVVGDQTWERQNKILIRVGPLESDLFERMLPNFESESQANDYSLLTELVRLFAGPEIEYEIQLVVKANSVPEAIVGADERSGLHLGWNSWICGSHESDLLFDTYLNCE